jgi:drug/metabolite transporter (DMT)-like permease
MLAGVAGYVSNDALTKLASEALPAFQIIFVRGVCAIAFLSGIGVVLRAPLHPRGLLDPWIVLRSMLEMLATACFVVSIAHLPLPNASAIFMVTPILTTLLAIACFGEHVGVRHWAAIVAGFAGVLLIVQPAGEGFNAWSLLVLLSAFFTAGRDIVTRRVSRDVPSLSITIFTLLVIVTASGVWVTVHDWRPASASQLGMLAAAGVLVSGGFFLTTVAIRVGEIKVIAPLRYTGLIVSSFLGWLIWNSVPNAVATCGMVLTVLAGTYLVRAR